MENAENWRKLKVLLRSLACAAGKSIDIDDLSAAYGKFTGSTCGIPYGSFGFDTVFDLIAAMPDVLKTINTDSEFYAVGVPESYNENKLNNIDLSKDTRQYDGIITGRTDRRKLWECIINPCNQISDHFKCKDDLFGVASNVVPDLNEVFAWKADVDHLYENYAKRRAAKLRIYTSRELLNLAPQETRQCYEVLAETAAAFIRGIKALTSESSDAEITMNKTPNHPKRYKNNHKKAAISAPPSTDALGVDLVFKQKNAHLFDAAALVFPENPHSFEMRGEVNVTKRVWQHVYAVMRLFPDGMSVSDFTQRYSQMFHKSLDYKSCGCRRLVWLLLRLPDVEVVRLPDGSPGIKLIKLPNKHPSQTYADKLTRFNQMKKSNENSDFSDDADDYCYPEYAPAEQSYDHIRLKCFECIEGASGGMSIAEMVAKLKPAVTMDENELTTFLAKFSDMFEIKVGADEQFYVRLAKFSGGHANLRENKLDVAKFLVTPAANIQQLNGEASPVENNCHIFPSTSRADVPLSDPIDGALDLRTYFYWNRFADYRISFRELENLYQSRANDLCKLDDILDKIKDLLLYCVVDYAVYEVRQRKTFSVSCQIERLSNLINRIDGVLYEKSSIIILDLEVGENIEVILSFVENCNKFFVKIVAMQSQIEMLRQIMNEFYNSTNSGDYMVPDQLLRANFICAAKVENTWHRVQIKDVIQRDLYSVFLLDDGRTDYVCPSNLRLLKEKFVDESMPGGAAEFSLYGIRPPQSQVMCAKDRFRELLSNAKNISASINEKRVRETVFTSVHRKSYLTAMFYPECSDKDKCASVTLYMYNSDDDIAEINQKLIDGGYGISDGTTTDSRIFSSEEHSPAVAQSSSSVEFSSDVVESPPKPHVKSSLNVNAQPFALNGNTKSRCQEEIVDLDVDLDKTLTITNFPNTTIMSVPNFCSPTSYQNVIFSQSCPEVGRLPSATTLPNFAAPLFPPMLGAHLRPPVIFPALPPSGSPNFSPNNAAPQTIFVPVYVPVPFPTTMQSGPPPAQFYPNHFVNSGPFLPAPYRQQHPAFPTNGFPRNL